MFDYASKMQLALSDAVRRVAIKAIAGVVALIGAGFLLAALWTFLARKLGWGPLGASLAIGLLFIVIAAVLMGRSKTVAHPVPTTDELRAEVETRVSLATDAALEKARSKATEVVDTVEDKLTLLVDTAADRAGSLVRDAESRVHGLTRDVASGAARKVGLTPQFFSDAQNTIDRVKDSNAATVPPVLGAFAVGLVLASKLKKRHRRDDFADYEQFDENWDDGYYR